MRCLKVLCSQENDIKRWSIPNCREQPNSFQYQTGNALFTNRACFFELACVRNKCFFSRLPFIFVRIVTRSSGQWQFIFVKFFFVLFFISIPILNCSATSLFLCQVLCFQTSTICCNTKPFSQWEIKLYSGESKKYRKYSIIKETCLPKSQGAVSTKCGCIYATTKNM